jgi:hypothetical protein
MLVWEAKVTLASHFCSPSDREPKGLRVDRPDDARPMLDRPACYRTVTAASPTGPNPPGSAGVASSPET